MAFWKGSLSFFLYVKSYLLPLMKMYSLVSDSSNYKINELEGWNVQGGNIVNNNLVSLYGDKGSQKTQSYSYKINEY